MSEKISLDSSELVSLNHWKQRPECFSFNEIVVICFQISIFEPLETTSYP